MASYLVRFLCMWFFHISIRIVTLFRDTNNYKILIIVIFDIDSFAFFALSQLRAHAPCDFLNHSFVPRLFSNRQLLVFRRLGNSEWAFSRVSKVDWPRAQVGLLFITKEPGFEADHKACSSVRIQHVGPTSNTFGCNIWTPFWMMLIDVDLNLNPL